MAAEQHLSSPSPGNPVQTLVGASLAPMALPLGEMLKVSEDHMVTLSALQKGVSVQFGHSRVEQP